MQSLLAAQALQCAKLLLYWCSKPENELAVSTFASSLINDLCTAQNHLHDECKRLTTKRERMWGRYHEIRSSDHFRITWSSFIQASVGCTASPILYQSLTDEIFKRLLKSTVSLSSIASSSESNDCPSCQLTYEEQNAVRYAAGYVCKKIRKQLESATCNKRSIIILS